MCETKTELEMNDEKNGSVDPDPGRQKWPKNKNEATGFFWLKIWVFFPIKNLGLFQIRIRIQ